MAVNAREKAELQQLWGKAMDSGKSIPDGTYQFQILSARFHMTDKGRPQYKTKVKITGGAQDYVGEEMEINDNLETSENMGWFKKKLRRLNITVPEDVDEIVDGSLAETLVGKIFEGQAKTKNDFLNVYVNRLIGESQVSGQKKEVKNEENAEDTSEEKTSEFEEGDNITWGNGKLGEIVEILADDNQARVRKSGTDSVVRVALNLLEKVNKKEVSEEVEEKNEEDSSEEVNKEKEKNSEEENEVTVELPGASEVASMKLPKVSEILASLGFDVDKLESPRSVLSGFCALVEDPNATLAISEVSPLANALGVEVAKGESFKSVVRKLSKAVSNHIK